MIENIRKYNILIIIGLVVVAAALVIGLQSSSMGGPGGVPYIKIGARTYNDTEYKQLGQYGLEITSKFAEDDFQTAMRLAQYDFELVQLFLSSGQFPSYHALDTLSSNSLYLQDQPDKTEQFFINRMLVRQAKKEFGIYPSDEQIDEYIMSLPFFQGADEEYDPEIYASFVKNSLGRMSMEKRHFRELISDIIATRHMRAVVSNGLLPNPDVTALSATLDQQQISGSVARLELESFKQEINPTDEQLKAYWELIQDAFMTREKRSFSYILVAPEPVEQQASTEDEAKEPTLAEAAMSDEAKAKAAKEKADKKAAEEARLAEERRLKANDLMVKVDDFMFTLEEADGKNLEGYAEKYKWEVRATELFDVDNVPTELDLNLRGKNRSGKAAKELFDMIITTDSLSRISEPLEVGENQWLVARLDETVKPRIKTFEEAREEVREQYIQEKALEAMEDAMQSAADKVQEALKAGKIFAEASKDAGLAKVEPFTDTTAEFRPTQNLFPNNLFQEARIVDPGEISEVIVQGSNAYLIYVESREVIEGSINPQAIENQLRIIANENGKAAFSDWLQAKTEAARIERYNRGQ